MESNGAQLTFVAPAAGTYLVSVRATGATNCPNYDLGVTRGVIDTFSPPVYH